MSALVVMLLLAFFLVIAVSLTIWAALGLNQHRAAPSPRPRPASERPTPTVVPRVTNDEVRGARVKVSQRAASGGDAFERFLRSDKSRDDADF